jgi:hypothetical protein
MNPLRLLIVTFLLMLSPAIAQEIATLTLVEGPLRVVRRTTVSQGAEGARLHPGDIIESSDPGFVQLEFTEGTIVVLGGSTRVLLLSHAGKVGNTAELVLLSGWLKCQNAAKVGTFRYDSPLIAATTQGGTLILHSSSTAAEIFVESGAARIAEVSPDGSWRASRSVESGQLSSRETGKVLTVSPAPSSTFVEAMPRPFRDTLSSLMPRYSGKPPQLERDHEVSYSEIQPWLTIGQTWRKDFVKRFQTRLADPAFRKALEAHLKDHPEWDPVLHPERYQQKTSPTASASPNPEIGSHSK